MNHWHEQQRPRLVSESCDHDTSDKELVKRIHGQDTDVIKGKSQAIAFGLVGFLSLGVCCVSLVVSFSQSTRAYNDVVSALVVALGKKPLYWKLLEYFPLICGTSVLVLCVLMIYFSLKSREQAKRLEQMVPGAKVCKAWFGGVNKCLVVNLSALALITVILQTIAISTSLVIMEQTDDAINRNGHLVFQDDDTRMLLGFGFTVFNECCAANGWSQQGPVPETCNLSNCTVPSRVQEYKSTLCTCHNLTGQEYSIISAKIKEKSVCQALANQTVHIETSDNIPGTSLTLGTVFNAPTSRVVGNFENNQACGAGYALGFQWVMYRWAYNFFNNILLTLVSLSIAQLLIIAYAIFTRWSTTRNQVMEYKIDQQVVPQSPRYIRKGIAKSLQTWSPKIGKISLFTPPRPGPPHPGSSENKLATFYLDP